MESLPFIRRRLACAARTQKPEFKTHSFAQEKDLWAFAHAALATGKAFDALEAYGAAQSCVSVIANNEQLSNFVSGGNSQIYDKPTPERQLAVAELRKRCAGFMAAGLQGSADLAHEAENKLKSAKDGNDSLHQLLTEPNPPISDLVGSDSPAMFTKLVQTRDWSGLGLR